MTVARRVLPPLILLGLWLGACYIVRYRLMEDPHWVAVCYGDGNATPACLARKAIGIAIHFRIFAYCGLALALPAFFLRGGGRRLAWASLFVGAPALALYTVTPAVFAALIAGLRLVRDERHSAAASSADAAAHPSA